MEARRLEYVAACRQVYAGVGKCMSLMPLLCAQCPPRNSTTVHKPQQPARRLENQHATGCYTALVHYNIHMNISVAARHFSIKSTNFRSNNERISIQ